MTVLVTGAAGFIGFHLTRRLLSRGDAVVGFDNVNDYYDVSLKEARIEELGKAGGEFVLVRGELQDRDRLAAAMAGVDRVAHLAAQAGVRYSWKNPEAFVDSNISGFLSLLEVAQRHGGVRHLVYASSSSVYGDNPVPFRAEDPVARPVSFYGATKVANELMAHVFYKEHGLNLTGLRFFTVYGPWGRPDMSPFLFLDAMVRGEPVRVHNEGRHKRDFTYIDDVVEGVLRVLDGAADEPDYRLYNIGRGSPTDLMDYIAILEALTGTTAEKVLEPKQPGDVAQTWADVGPLARDFGYRPTTDLEEGLRRFVAWYRGFYGV